jgi:hypothetical protein
MPGKYSWAPMKGCVLMVRDPVVVRDVRGGVSRAAAA